jgi:predicted RNA-binding Zn-ribbon protein involved in translation (DUF1610 family)
MTTKSKEIKKKRKRKVIPEVDIRCKVTRTYEVICPECKEIIKDSTENYQILAGKYTCDNCGEKFKAMVAQSKRDGRGKIADKEQARRGILNMINRSGPISAQKLGEKLDLCKVTRKKILDNLEEEGLIEHASKGWIWVE